MEEEELTFRKYKFYRQDIHHITETLTVNGKDVEVLLDTGKEDFLTGSLQHARNLNLDLVDVSAENCVYITECGRVPIDYRAYDVSVQCLGTE